jgi:hypothetical protein
MAGNSNLLVIKPAALQALVIQLKTAAYKSDNKFNNQTEK